MNNFDMKRILRGCYLQARKLLDTVLLGTRFQEWLWKKDEFSDSKTYESMFLEAIKHPHRNYLIERVNADASSASVLELGCHQGYNLYVLNQKSPGLQLYGIDINSRAIQEGVQRFSSIGIPQIKLTKGACDNLSSFESNSMDVIFSDAIIIYIGPDKIHKAIEEWLRVTRKSIILYEWNWVSPSPDELSIYETGHWIHDYSKLFSGLPGVKSVTIQKIPDRVNYQDVLWKKYGALVEVYVK